MDSSDFLEQAIHTSLINLTSSNATIRGRAEEHVKLMKIVPGYTEHLIGVALRETSTLHGRQMAVLLMKKHIEENWSKPESDFAIDKPTVKSSIRGLLLTGLKQSNRTIRNSFSYCLAYIIAKDWPNEWSDCFVLLQHHLDTESAMGIIKLYIELLRLVEDVTTLAPILTVQLGSILTKPRVYPLGVRIEGVYCLTILHSTLQGSGEDLLFVKFPEVLSVLMRDLRVDCSKIDDYEYKSNIIQFITVVVQKMGKEIIPFLTSFLPTVWSMVKNFGDLYCEAVMLNKDIILEMENDEGKPRGFTPLILSILDLIQCLVECSELRALITDVLVDIIYYTMIFMLITQKMENVLSDDYVQYFSDSKDKYEMCLRITATNVLLRICSDFEESLALSALCGALNRHFILVTEQENFNINSSCYWRIHEICQYTLGMTKDLMLRGYQNGELDFDVKSYLERWQYLPPVVPMILTSRCTWFAARYSSLLSEQMYIYYIEFVLNQIRSMNPILRISALRTICELCENTETTPNLTHLKQYFNYIFPHMCNVNDTKKFEYGLSLRTMRLMLTVKKEVYVANEEKIISVLTYVYANYYADPDMMKRIKNILKIICKIERCIQDIQEKLVPIFCYYLPHSELTPSCMHAASIDLLQTVIMYSRLPFRDILLEQGFLQLLKGIAKTDDPELLMNSTECLRWIIIFGADKIYRFTSNETTSVELIFIMLYRLLDPLGPPEACEKIGRFIITFITKFGLTLESIHHILKAVLSKMQRIANSKVWQSLLIVFCYIFCVDAESLINFLTSIPGPTGDSAFQFVLNQWLWQEYFMIGYYEHILSAVGLCKVLEYGVTMTNIDFDKILVRHEIIERETDGRPPKYSMIPVLGKVFKTLVGYLVHQMGGTEESYVSEDESSLTEHIRNYEYDDEMASYDTFAQDAIFQIDELNYLTDFMHRFKLIPNYDSFYALLSPKQQRSLDTLPHLRQTLG